MSGVIAAAGIGAAAGLYGASRSSKATKNAANTQAAAQTEAARIAADEARFRPWDTSNAFGSVDWGTDANGRVNQSNLTPSAWINGLSKDAQGNYNNYQNLFSQYYNPNLQAGGNQIYNEWQNLLAPTRSAQQTGLFDALQAKGITGVQGYDPLTGTGVNPMANSLFSSWAGQDQQMAAGSINEYLSRLAQLQAGTDTARGAAVGVNELPLNNVLGLSASLGGRNANAQGSSALMQGLSGAAQTQAQGQVANAATKNSFWQGLGNSISGMDWSKLSTGTSSGGLTGTSGWSPSTNYEVSSPDYGFSGASLGTTGGGLSNW